MYFNVPLVVLLSRVSPRFHLLIYCYAICVAENLQGFVTRGKLNQEKLKRTLSLLKGTLDFEDLKDVDMVIEVIH